MEKTLTEISEELNQQSGFAALPGLIFITDQQAQACPENVIGTMPEGSMVIFRDYDANDRFELGRALRYMCAARRIKFLVAGDLALSLALDADGIHLPEYMVSQAGVIRAQHPDYFISAAAHTEDAVANAVSGDIDAVLLAPIFATHSHPETFEYPSRTIGVDRLKAACEKFDIAIFALGGINAETASELFHSGVTGVAAIRGIS